MKKAGIVYLVGAGPGDVGLLTLRGAELLARADVVVYDALVNTELLRLAPRSAELIYGGKRAKGPAVPQSEVNALLVSKARAGQRVVRLKGGDPYIFGRGGEEAEQLAAAGIAFEVVPGISSVVAGPNYAGIPLTHRDHCSSFTVLTGHEDPSKESSSLDYEQIVGAPGTKVILMGVERIRQITEALLRHGMPKDTPAAVVRWGTTGRQQSIHGPLETLADQVEQSEFSAPAVIVLGSVVKLREQLNWFENRPLFNRKIVVTRAGGQAGSLTKELKEMGADVLEIPTIKIVPPDNLQPLTEALLGLGAYNWLVFTSPNGVGAFFDYFFKSFQDLRDIGGVRIAAVGPGTAAKLKELHLQVDVVPGQSLARELPKAMAAFESIENLTVLLPRAQKASPELPKRLEELGAIVDDIACYKTVPETEDENGAAERFLKEGADWITFTSGSTVEHFHARFNLPMVLKKFPTLKLASIGPETSKAILALNLKPALEAKTHSIAGLVQALAAWE